MKQAISGAILFALLSTGACGDGDESPSVWEHAGRDVDTNVIQSYQGADHCGWQDVIFLDVGWPLGTAGVHGKGRMYVRDPERVLVDQWVDEFQQNARLPEDADFTGYSGDVGELWLSPGDEDSVVYIVSEDRQNVEAWPRTESLIGCD